MTANDLSIIVLPLLADGIESLECRVGRSDLHEALLTARKGIAGTMDGTAALRAVIEAIDNRERVTGIPQFNLPLDMGRKWLAERTDYRYGGVT